MSHGQCDQIGRLIVLSGHTGHGIKLKNLFDRISVSPKNALTVSFSFSDSFVFSLYL